MLQGLNRRPGFQEAVSWRQELSRPARNGAELRQDLTRP